MIRLVLSDLDATLVWRPDHVATPLALRAVRELRASGVRFAPCTGRIHRDLPAMFAGDATACETAVTSNGQLVFLDGELVGSVPADRDALLSVMEELRGVPDAYLVVESAGKKRAVDEDLGFVLANPDVFWRVESVLPTVPEEPCYKANVRVVGSYERTREVASALSRAHPELDFLCPIPGVAHIDVTPRGMGKDFGARLLAERLGLSPEEVCVFGDGENDVAVMRCFPHSVAVASAVPAVLEAARWRVGPAGEDSVARALLDIAEAARTGCAPAFMGATGNMA